MNPLLNLISITAYNNSNTIIHMCVATNKADLEPHHHYQEFTLHYDHLLRYAKKLTGNLNDAQDLVQETFLRAFKYHKNFQLGTNARSWLYKVMYHLFLTRARRKQQEYFNDINDINEVDETLLNHNSQGDHGLSDQISVAIQKLNPRFRTPLLLKTLLGYKYYEISRITGVPIATIKTRIHRAKEILGRQLNMFSTKS